MALNYDSIYLNQFKNNSGINNYYKNNYAFMDTWIKPKVYINIYLIN
jgi:hypothetical protein